MKSYSYPFVLALSVVLFSCFGCGALAQEGVTNVLKAANQERGLFQKEPEGGATTVVTKGGSAARSTTPPDGKTGGFMSL